MSALLDINSEWQDIVTFAWKKSEFVFLSENLFFYLIIVRNKVRIVRLQLPFYFIFIPWQKQDPKKIEYQFEFEFWFNFIEM